ncbi:PdaC/SigV domain-containing protein [Hyphomonas sp.]|uniref:PdaC/SigV domain-containing protein n=1 Tax=Hyphomonas sp. TaxID=87 RepID=UPI00391AD6C3
MIRLLASVSVAAFLLAACAPETEVSQDSPIAEEVPAGDDTIEPAMAFDMPGDFQLSYSQESDAASVSSELDPAILAFDPQLAYSLWKDAKSSVDEMMAQAAGDQTMATEDAAASGDPSWFRPYTMEISSKATLVLDDLISIEHFIAQYTGGAHGNYFMGGGIYRKGEAEPVKLVEMIADEPGFRALVVNGLVEEKIKRGYEEGERAVIASELGDLLVPSADYPDVFDGHVVLQASEDAGKIGGMVVLFSPYEVGSFAEGSYEILIPAADLAPVLAPGWKDRFGGAPLPLEPN